MWYGRNAIIPACFHNSWRDDTLRPRQQGCHYANNTFIFIFVNENCSILTKISLKFISNDLINSKPSLVQIVTQHHTGNKPLSEPKPIHWRPYESPCLDELISFPQNDISIVFSTVCVYIMISPWLKYWSQLLNIMFYPMSTKSCGNWQNENINLSQS